MKLTKRRWFVIIAGAGVLMLSAYALVPDAPVVETIAVSRGPLVVSVASQGITRVRERFDIAAPVTGQVLRVDVHAGDAVVEGTPIVHMQPAPLDPKQQAQLDARLLAARRNREESNAMVRRAAESYAHAHREAERLRKLSADIVSREQMDAASNAEALASKDLEAARFRAQAAAFEVEAATAAAGAIGTRAEITLSSPVRGAILRVHRESEAVVQAGTPIVQVGDPRSIEVVADFLSTDAVKVRAGDDAWIEAWGGGKPLRARVRLVEPSGFMKVSALGVEEQRVNILADPLDLPQNLGDQFRVDLRVVIWKGTALKVPSTAIFSSPDGWKIFAVRGNRARVVKVTLGHTAENEVEVTGGLSEGDRVIAHPSDEVRDGIRIRARSVAAPVAFLFTFLFGAPIAAAQPAPAGVTPLLRVLAQTGALTIDGDPICAAGPLQTFYRRRDNAPAWNDANAAALLRSINRSDDDGLDPLPYHAAAIASTTGAQRDLLLTDAYLLYGTHLLQGRTDPQSLDSAWCIEARKMDLPAVLQAALDDGTIEQSLARLAPRADGYTRLRAALAGYRAIDANGGWPMVDPGPTLRKGDGSPRTRQLAGRLGLQTDVFNDALVERVRVFQSHHGLTADGVVGNATLRELNVPVAARIEQVAANMERWRWMPDELGPSHIVVNIAAFELKVTDRGQTVITMKTIVGKLYKNTPFFPAQIKNIVFNPYWNVPDKIADEELWPKQRRDRRYFAREHYEVVAGNVRQTPGPWNALGLMKFDMPNRFLVYLHDTPARSLFSAETRMFSHGCIRLEKPEELARWLLRDQPQWTPHAIRNVIETGKERWVTVTPVPVYVLYWTAFVADDGDLEFRRDVYGRDIPLIAALRESHPLRSPLTPGE